MTKAEAGQKLTDLVARFTVLVGERLPDDVTAKLRELHAAETQPMARMVYESMEKNQALAQSLHRPSCQDTGVIQMFARVGTNFPYRDGLDLILKDAVARATQTGPLRHNTVETFDEYNTGTNTGTGSPWIYWDLLSGSDKLELDVYMAGGGCSLPGAGKTLMPGEGYEGAVKFVMDRMTSYGLNACPPLLVGVGIGTCIDAAAFLSKRALMRPVGSHNANPRAAQLEEELTRAIDSIGLGPQGLGGARSVLGVHIENAARHPAVLAVAVNVGCWSHRRGGIVIGPDLSYEMPAYKGVTL